MGIISKFVRKVIGKPNRLQSNQSAFNSAQINYSTPITYRAATPIKPGQGLRISTLPGTGNVNAGERPGTGHLFRRRRGL